MKSQWPIWVFLIGVVIIVLVTFNYQGGRDTVPMGEIFPEVSEQKSVDIEYEFVPADPGTSVVERTTPTPDVVSERTPQPAPVSQPEVRSAGRPETNPPAAQAEEAQLTIQIMSSKDAVALEKALVAAQAKGYPAYIVSKDLGDKGTWYRIYVGKFQQKTEADAYLQKVRSNYQDAFVRRP